MEDIIDIIVTETTNLIEITSQPTDEIIDVNIIDNREDITLNVTPSVVEININSLTGNFGVNWGDIEGTLSNQTDLQNVLNAKADLVDGKVPSSQLPSYVDDVVEVANYAALPVTGEVGKIYITLDTNFIYRWSGSTYIEIKDSTAVWGAITGTLSSQTDLQSALDAKVPYTGATGNVNLGEYGATVGYLGFDTTPTSTPTGIGTTYWDSFYRTLSLIDGDGDTTLQIGQEERVLVHNNTGSTLTDGQVVYVIGSTGELPSVALASNTSETTSSVTFGIVTESIAHGANGFITTSGIIHGLNTNAYDEGAAIYLGSTAGTFTQTKPVAPANSVLVGYIIKKSGGNGSIFVKIQNGYELEELHDVLITSKANNDGLFYESSTSLWKNKSIATVLGYTPANGADYLPLAGGTMIGAIVGTTATFTNSSGIGLGVTQSGPTGDGVKITHSAGRAFNIQSSGGGFGILINNETASTSFPFTIQKQGLGVVTLTDSGDGVFDGSLTANSFIKTGGTSSQFLKADGSVDSTAYLPLAGGTLTGGLNGTFGNFISYVNAQTIDISNSTAANALRITHTNGSYHAVSIVATGNSALYASGNVTVVGTITSTGVISAQSGLANGIGQSFALPTTSGTLALTSQLSSYLPLSGGTLTGALTIGPLDGQALKLQASSSTGVTYLRFFNSAGTQRGYFGLFNSGGTDYTLLDGSSTDVTINGNTNLSLQTGGSNRLNITSSGNVGIGTTSPTDYSGYTTLHLNGKSGGNGGLLRLTAFDASSSVNIYAGGSAINFNTTAAVPFVWLTQDTERMRITSDGIVQLSTTSSIPTTNNSIYSYSGNNFMYIQGGSAGLALSATGARNNIMYLNESSNYIRFDTSGSERMRITSGGNVLIGTTSNTAASINTTKTLQVNNEIMSVGSSAGIFWENRSTPATTSANWYGWYTTSGTIYLYNGVANVASINPSTGIYLALSDKNKKKDLEVSNIGLNEIMKLKPTLYRMKSDSENDSKQLGFIAQEVKEVLPQAYVQTKTENEDFIGLNFNPIVAALTKAVQELKAELDILKNK